MHRPGPRGHSMVRGLFGPALADHLSSKKQRTRIKQKCLAFLEACMLGTFPSVPSHLYEPVPCFI